MMINGISFRVWQTCTLVVRVKNVNFMLPDFSSVFEDLLCIF